MNDNYWRKENPKYIKLQCDIEQKQNKINSGVITNERTLKYAKRDIKHWENELTKTERYVE